MRTDHSIWICTGNARVGDKTESHILEIRIDVARFSIVKRHACRHRYSQAQSNRYVIHVAIADADGSHSQHFAGSCNQRVLPGSDIREIEWPAAGIRIPNGCCQAWIVRHERHTGHPAWDISTDVVWPERNDRDIHAAEVSAAGEVNRCRCSGIRGAGVVDGGSWFESVGGRADSEALAINMLIGKSPAFDAALM